jgi:hypothetical protein
MTIGSSGSVNAVFSSHLAVPTPNMNSHPASTAGAAPSADISAPFIAPSTAYSSSDKFAPCTVENKAASYNRGPLSATIGSRAVIGGFSVPVVSPAVTARAAAVAGRLKEAT